MMADDKPGTAASSTNRRQTASNSTMVEFPAPSK